MVWPSAHDPSTLTCNLTADYMFKEQYELTEYGSNGTQRESKEQRQRERWKDGQSFPTWRSTLPKHCCITGRTKQFCLPAPRLVQSRCHQQMASGRMLSTFRDLNFWFTRCFISAGEIQSNIFVKDFKTTSTPTGYILVSLRPVLTMNQCCHTHTASVDFQWSKETRTLVL
jgi:hypothetical protein